MAKHYDIYRSASAPDPAYVTLWLDESASPAVLKRHNGVAWTQAGVQGPPGIQGDPGIQGVPGIQGPPGSLASHKATHATGGSDQLTPADIGASATGHAHAASDVTSGVFGVGRLGTGTAGAGKYLDGSGAWTTLPSGNPAAEAVSYAAALDGAVTRDARSKLRESVSVQDFGAAGLGSTNLGWIASGSPTLNLKDENEDFQVGHRIRVAGAGAAGGILSTTVSAVVGPKTLTLAANASTAVLSTAPGLVEHRTTLDTGASAGATTLEVDQVWTWKAGQGVCVPGGGQAEGTAAFELTILGPSTAAGTVSVTLDPEHIFETASAAVGSGATANGVRAALQNAVNADQARFGYVASAPGSTNVLRLVATTPGPRTAPTFDDGNITDGTWATVGVGRHAKDYFGEITNVAPDTSAPGSPATLTVTPALTRAVSAGVAVLRYDAPAFRRALSSGGRRVTLPPVPGGYGLSYESKLKILPGTTVEGSGWPGRLVRIGTYDRGGRMFLNVLDDLGGARPDEAPNNVTVRGVHAVLNKEAAVAEHTYSIGGVPTGKKQGFWDAIFFVLNSNDPDRPVRNLTVSETVVDGAPGPAWHVHNSRNATFVGNTVVGPFRGGIILVKDTRRAAIVGNVVEESNDDGIAINAAPGWASGTDCVISGNFASSSTGSHMHAGSAIAIRSCVGTVVSGNRVAGGRTCGIYVQEEVVGVPPRRNTIVGNVVTDAYGEGIRVMTRSNGARGIQIVGNTVHNSGTAGIRVESYIEAGLVLRGVKVSQNFVDATGLTTASADAKAGIHLQGRNSADATWFDVDVSGNQITGAWTNAVWLGNVASANLVHVNDNMIENCNASNTASTPAIHVGLVNRFSLSGNSLYQPGANKPNYLLNIACASTARGVYQRNIAVAADVVTGLVNNVNGATLTSGQNVV